MPELHEHVMNSNVTISTHEECGRMKAAGGQGIGYRGRSEVRVRDNKSESSRWNAELNTAESGPRGVRLCGRKVPLNSP